MKKNYCLLKLLPMWKKCRWFGLFGLILFVSCFKVTANTAYTGMREISSFDLAQDMGIGWNLGNALDAHGDWKTGLEMETMWWNPYTTKAMIDKVKAKGFNYVRIPVTWHHHLGSAPDYQIDKAWLDRVEEIVNYVLANDMYVSINIHHDDHYWLVPTYEKEQQVTQQLEKIWTQLANRFKDYGDYLLFETMNETRLIGSPEEWNGGTQEGRTVVNHYNLAAVNAIRATGGNNAKRHIIINGYASSAVPAALESIEIPNNDPRIIVGFHNYYPWNFCGNEDGGVRWGSDADKAALSSSLSTVERLFLSKGRAVILGEWGTMKFAELEDRVVYAEYYMQEANKRNILTAVWDDGGYFELLNRDNVTWKYPTIVDALMEGYLSEEQEPETPPETPSTPSYTEMRNMTSVELTKEMGIGWNLGNALDAHGDWLTGLEMETMWGNPYSTKAMIDKVKQQGFNYVRIPITWHHHLGEAPDYKIDKAWLDRVEEVVNYVLDNEMYASINVHHDDHYWLVPTYEKEQEVTEELEKIWTQVATRFKNYGDRLLFETMNETRVIGSPAEWNGGTAEGRTVVNHLNLAGVNAIRATGGNNAKRHLIINGYASSAVPVALESIEIPNNDPRVIVGFHNYYPWDFCGNEDGDVRWGSDADKAALSSSLDIIDRLFTSKGRAVMLGEWGAMKFSELEDRVAYAEYYMQVAKERNILSVVWDDGGNFQLLNRNALQWKYPSVVDAIIRGYLPEEETEFISLPAKIEAEDYTDMEGVQTEATSDNGGGHNIGWIDRGDWFEYKVNVPKAGNYRFNFRIASQSQAIRMIVKVSGKHRQYLYNSSTGGWQNWITVSRNVYVEKGNQTIRFEADGGQWNLNWFEITPNYYKSGSIGAMDEGLGENIEFKVYPNPTKDILTIRKGDKNIEKVKMLDMNGRVVYQDNDVDYEGDITISTSGLGLEGGVYILQVVDEKGIENIQVIKQ